MVSEDFLNLFYNTSKDVANLNPRGMVGWIYVESHRALGHIKYRSCWPHGFREDFFFKFFPPL